MLLWWKYEIHLNLVLTTKCVDERSTKNKIVYIYLCHKLQVNIKRRVATCTYIKLSNKKIQFFFFEAEIHNYFK